MEIKGKQLSSLSALQLREVIEEKLLSPVEVITYFLEEIERANPTLMVFNTIAKEEALAQAKEAEKAVLQGRNEGALLGIPVAIKDLTTTKGIRTTYGSKVFEHHIPTHDAVVVKRIKEAGGIIIGKTNTPEFGHKGTTDNTLFGTAKNPWNHALATGGSSGGSAASVAAGLVPLAEGTDGGGSVRIPASLCGVYGFKPTFGRIPFDYHQKNVFSSLTPFLHHGTFSRTTEDAALLLSVLVGADSGDPFSLPTEQPNWLENLTGDVKGLRIAYSPNLDFYEIDHAVGKVIRNAAGQFSNLGCHVDEVQMNFSFSKEELIKAFVTLWVSSLATNYQYLLEEHESLLTPNVVKMIHMGGGIDLREYKLVEMFRTKVYQDIERMFQSYDVIICPTLAVAGFAAEHKGPKEINGKKINPNTDWILTQMANLTGHPAASLPVGFTEDGQPVGLQIIGKRLDERTILQLSHAFEVNYGLKKMPE